MTTIFQHPEVKLEVTMKLTEGELRALDAMAGYGADAFMKNFYQLGEHYMRPYDKPMRELIERLRGEVGPILRRIDKARAAFKE